MMIHRFAIPTKSTLPLEGRVAKLGPQGRSVAREGVSSLSAPTQIQSREQSHG
jgi:hypothetical protein